MKFAQILREGRLLRRYKRFLADIELVDGTQVTAACPNTGSLLGCAIPGHRVWLSESETPSRKYRYTWELVEVDGVKIGINTGLPNKLVAEAITSGVLVELSGYQEMRREVAFGTERSRVDLLLTGSGRADCYVEVKNVTAAVSDGVALFPDAISARGAKHLRELMRLQDAGLRAVLVYCVQRGDVSEVRPADAIDALYGQTLRSALAVGVEVLAYRARVTTHEIEIDQAIAVVCP